MERRPRAGSSRAPALRKRERLAMNRFLIALLFACAAGTSSHAMEGGQQRGKALLEAMCARCHAVGNTGRSPHVDAPPFRSFGDDKLYDNDFTQRLQDGLSSI